ncbi:MAG: NAD(P)H-dependent glycerol-3-phosphate dehydrogenase [Gammaproteobacteria bacterium]|nr:NAD(P)H-dependent glycerol-3-phosphate dehydrogenase [Gammaproteobacteria bacterium]
MAASKTFTVIGAGSWGTALALLLARNQHKVLLWTREESHRLTMQAARENTKYLPGNPFPESLQLTNDLTLALKQSDHVLVCVPSHAFRDILLSIHTYITPSMGLVWATKGLDPETGQFLDQVARGILPDNTPFALLTGPSFAKEVAKQQPTIVTLASDNMAFIESLQDYFQTPYFRTYLCDDIKGAELGGAVKNILAIAVGIAEGLGYGTNTKAGLMTRGLAEMMRLGTAIGADKETLMGLSGLGDLILTCSDMQSRNLRFGVAIGKGKSFDETYHEIGQVVEGVQTTASICKLAEHYKVDMPITKLMYAVLYQNLPAKEAVNLLLSRETGLE